MTHLEQIRKRLAQIRASLLSEGWLYVGAMGDQVIHLRHPRNGNRMTIVCTDGYIAYLKNGRLVKCEPMFTARDGSPVANAPATPLT